MLHYKVLGEGKPIFILHGFLGMLDNWLTVGNMLSENYKVFLIDQRNHGRSPHLTDTSYEAMANDILEIMEHEGLEGIALIGHSMGGKTAMQFALNYPERVSNLVVVDMAARAYKAGHLDILAALNKVNFVNVNSRKDVEKQLSESIKDIGVRLFLMKNLKRSSDGIYAWRMNLPVLSKTYDNVLQPIESKTVFYKPTLFIRGGKSDYVNENDLENMKTMFPKATLETIEGAGHWVHAEKPDETYEAIRAFLLPDQ